MASSSSYSYSSPPPLSLNVVGSDTFTVPTPPPPHRLSPLQNLSPSILIIVTVLAVTVILSLSLCFLLRHLNRRCLRRLSAAPSSSASAATPIFTSSRRISPEIAPASSVIDALPLFSFSSVTRRSASAAADCAVCLSKFDDHDLLRLLPLCCHAFHAQCIDTWLQSNLTCPLCRSAIAATESDLAKSFLRRTSSAAGSDSFRLEIGNVSRRGASVPDSAASAGGGGRSRSYSIGSFEYFVDEESEVPFSQAHRRSVSDHKDELPPVESPAAQTAREPSLAGEVAGAGSRSWLKDYVDRVSASISSRTASFRSSGRFFSGGGSSRRSDAVLGGEFDVEGNRMGEEITEMFRWLSGV